MSVPKEFTTNKSLSMLFILYIIISPILTLISSITSNPNTDFLTTVIISIILIITVVLISVPMILLINKENQRAAAIKNEKLEMDKERWKMDKERWETDKNYMSLEKLGPALPDIIKSPAIQEFLQKYMKGAMSQYFQSDDEKKNSETKKRD